MHVAPLAHPQVVDEHLAAALELAALRQALVAERREELPQVHEREEVRALVAEAQVRLVGGLRALERPLARIAHGQRARDHQRLGDAVALARGEHDAADARVERQRGEFAADRRQRAPLVDRAQVREQLVAVRDRARQRRLDEGERGDRRPSSSDAICRITLASELRRISGSAKRARAA